jgi:S1-C subfamily serine protease
MDKKQTLILFTGALLISGFAISSYSIPFQFNSDGLLAAVKKVKPKIYNIYTKKPEPYLYVNAPGFKFLPLTKENFNPKQIIQSLSTPVVVPKVTVSPIIENSLVNIFCSQKVGKVKKTITGSGVLINLDGTVLTNSHVAQFPLVADSNNAVVCIARIGSPAQTVLSVKTAFISPEWLKINAKYINSGGGPETGQSDYALLNISYPDGRTLNMYPSPIDSSPVQVGTDIQAVSYPADILGTKGVDSALYIKKESLQVIDLFTFIGVTSNHPDVIQTSDTTIGQGGSSGGALTNQKGALLGLITTVTDGSTPSKKQIRGISVGHIQDEFSKYHTGGILDVANHGSLAVMKEFNSSMRAQLTSTLSSYLSF